MIVTTRDFGWEIIHQPAHALLSLQLALPWRPDKRPLNWPETLVALTEHDDGQDRWQGRNHLTKAGAPLDFQIQRYSMSQAHRMVEIALQKSRWNALLVSMHACFLYESMRQEKKEIADFLDQQQTNQQAWLRTTNVSQKQAQYGYDFLQWCDAFSLLLCQDHIPPAGRRLEISVGPDDVPYYVSQQTDGSLTVDPWPYEIPSFVVGVEVFELHQLAFQDDSELYQALQQATITRREWTLSAHPAPAS